MLKGNPSKADDRQERCKTGNQGKIQGTENIFLALPQSISNCTLLLAGDESRPNSPQGLHSGGNLGSRITTTQDTKQHAYKLCPDAKPLVIPIRLVFKNLLIKELSWNNINYLFQNWLTD